MEVNVNGTDTKFNFSVAILLTVLFCAMSTWAVVGGITGDAQIVNTIAGVFSVWGIWLVAFIVILFSVLVRIILYYAYCIKHHELGNGTNGVELSCLAVVIGVFSVGYGVPKIATAIGNFYEIPTFSAEIFSPMMIMTMIVIAIWFILFITDLILSLVAEIKYMNYKKQATVDKLSTVEPESTEKTADNDLFNN